MGGKKLFTLEQQKEIALRFRDFRRENGLTKGDLARLLKVSLPTIGNVESLKYEPRASTFMRFKALEDEFVARKEALEARVREEVASGQVKDARIERLPRPGEDGFTGDGKKGSVPEELVEDLF